MTIRPLGFVDTSVFTANYVLRHKDKVVDGLLYLRDLKGDELDASDLPILREWKSAKALLVRLKAGAAPHFDGVTPELGRVWIEVVPPGSGTPWFSEVGDYAEAHLRTRTCLIPSPGALSYSGATSANLLVGIVNLMDHHSLCSEVNAGDHPRVHLVVDLKAPVDEPEV